MAKTATRNKKFKRFADFLKVVADENRLIILCLVFGRRGLCVSEVAAFCGLSVADASHHLRLMARQGWIMARRRGKKVCYAPRLGQNKILADFKRLVCRYQGKDNNLLISNQ